jgi:hypothetical protein
LALDRLLEQSKSLDELLYKLRTENSAGSRFETQELCVDNVCVTRDQFAEVFGSQSAAAGAPVGVTGEAPASPPNGGQADTATEANDNHSPDDTPLADTALEPVPELEPAYDNSPAEDPQQAPSRVLNGRSARVYPPEIRAVPSQISRRVSQQLTVVFFAYRQ